MKKIRLIELFGGIGAQAKALENLGVDFEHYGMIEVDAQAVCAYNAIHNTHFITNDITQITGNDLHITETDKYNYIVTYSFPCQDLSPAGKQAGMDKGSGTRSGLLWEVERLLNECEQLPQVLVMENVTLVHGKKNISNFNNWCAFLESKGYKNFWQDLNAKNFGVPQNRNRCFMVSILGDKNFVFPKPVILTKNLNDILEDTVDESFYLTENSDSRFYQQAFEVFNSTECKEGYIIDAFNKKLNISGISPTLTTRPEGFKTAILPIVTDRDALRIRKLTPKEAWLTMGFKSEDYEKAHLIINEIYYKGKDRSKTVMYKLAGNSIVVNVLEYVFKQILEILN